MSNRDDEGEDKGEPTDLEEETRRLMDKAMKSDMPDKESAPTSTAAPEKEAKAEVRSKTAVQIDETFQRIQARMDDLLSGIEVSLKAAEPGIDKQVSSCVKNLETVLRKEAGLGVFATKTAKLVKEELENNLTIEQLLAPAFDAISESRATVEDILGKAGRGAVRDVGRSTGGLQTRLVQVYAKLTELENQLEMTRAEVREWRTRANELEDLIKSKEESIEQSSEDMVRLRETQDEMTRQMEQHEQEISSLKGELGQAQAPAAASRTRRGPGRPDQGTLWGGGQGGRGHAGQDGAPQQSGRGPGPGCRGIGSGLRGPPRGDQGGLPRVGAGDPAGYAPQREEAG